MCQCNEARVRLFVPDANRLRLKIGVEKPKIVVHPVSVLHWNNYERDVYDGVSAYVGRLLYLDQMLLSKCEHSLSTLLVAVR